MHEPWLLNHSVKQLWCIAWPQQRVEILGCSSRQIIHCPADNFSLTLLATLASSSIAALCAFNSTKEFICTTACRTRSATNFVRWSKADCPSAMSSPFEMCERRDRHSLIASTYCLLWWTCDVMVMGNGRPRILFNAMFMNTLAVLPFPSLKGWISTIPNNMIATIDILPCTNLTHCCSSIMAVEGFAHIVWKRFAAKKKLFISVSMFSGITNSVFDARTLLSLYRPASAWSGHNFACINCKFVLSNQESLAAMQLRPCSNASEWQSVIFCTSDAEALFVFVRRPAGWQLSWDISKSLISCP